MSEFAQEPTSEAVPDPEASGEAGSETIDEPAGGGKPKRKRKWLRRLVLVVCLLVLLVVVFVALLPTLLSGPLLNFALGTANKYIPGEVEIDQLSLSWFGGQEISGLRLKDTDGTQVVSADRIAVPQVAIFWAVLGDTHLGRIEATGVTADIVERDDGTTNLQHALVKPGSSETKPKPKNKPAKKPGEARAIESELTAGIDLKDINLNYTPLDGAPSRVTLNKAAFDVDSMLGRLTMDVDGQVAQGDDTGNILANAKITNVVDAQGALVLDEAELRAEATLSDIPVSAIDRLTGQGGKLVALLGPVLNASVNTTGTINDLKVELAAKSQHTDTVIVAVRATEGYTLDTTRSRITLALQPELVDLVAAEGGMGLADPVAVDIRFHELTLPADMNFADGSFGMSIDVDRIAPTGNERLAGTTVENLTIDLPVAPIAGERSVTLNADIVDGQTRQQLTAETSLHVDPDHPDEAEILSANLALAPLSIVWVDRVLDQNGQFAVMLGQDLENVEVAVTGDPRQSFGFTVNAFSRLLNVSLPGRFDHGEDAATLSVSDDAHIMLVLTPHNYRQLMALREANKDAAFTLSEPAPISIVVRDLSVRLPNEPAEGEPAYNPADLRADMTFSAPTLAMRRGEQETITVRDLNAELATTDPTKQLTLTARAGVTRQVGAGAPSNVGELTSDTTIAGLYNAQNQLDAVNSTITTETRLDQFPVELLDSLLAMNGQLIAALGTTAAVNASGSYPGDLDIQMQSDQASASLPITVDRQRNITLRENVVATMQPSEQTFEQLLGKVQPVLADAVAAEKPIKLTIQREGFLLPLQDMDVRKLNIAGELDLGVLRMRRDGWVNQAMRGVFNQLGSAIGLPGLGGRREAQDTYLATFTPMTFEVRDGKAKTSELWMTAPDMAMGFQGGVDLADRKASLDMGILGATFYEQLGSDVTEYIDPARVYTLPVSGTLGNLKPNVAGLVMEFASVAGKRAAGGEGGELIDLGTKVLGDILSGGNKKSQDQPKQGGTPSTSTVAWHPPQAANELVTAIQQQQEQERQRRLEQQQRRQQQNQGGAQQQSSNSQPAMTPEQQEELRKEQWREQHRERLRQQREQEAQQNAKN